MENAFRGPMKCLETDNNQAKLLFYVKLTLFINYILELI